MQGGSSIAQQEANSTRTHAVNDAARAIVNMTLAPRGTLRAATSASAHNVVNFIHPKTFTSAAKLFQPLIAGTPAKLVPLADWLGALRKLQDSQHLTPYTSSSTSEPFMASLNTSKFLT